jgi:hypothetical protein
VSNEWLNTSAQSFAAGQGLTGTNDEWIGHPSASGGQVTTPASNSRG